MRDFTRHSTNLPLEQEAIRAKCFHPTGTFVEFPREDVETSVPERFEKIVQRYPNRLAVKMGDRALTYDELNKAANRLARAILDKRGPGNEPIALLFEHDIDGIIAILGVLKGHKSYVFLDPSFPTDRIRYILRDSNASLVVVNNRTASLACRLQATNDAILNIENVNCAFPTPDPQLPILPQDMAAIIYTSGSTGLPKGVIVTHGYHLNYARVFSNEVQVSAEDRLSLLHSLSFSSAIVNLVRALLNGSTLFPFDFKTEGIDRLEKWLSAERITIFHSPPALFRQLVNAMGGRTFTDLRIIELSGAPITTAEFDAYERVSAARTLLEFQMGSTEAGTITSALVNRRISYPSQGFPVGYACPGRQISLLDENGHEVAQGKVGEIAVRGRHMASGYWKNPELTKAKFLPAPGGGDERIFLTGDLGQMMPDGLIVHRGRKDLMVKIRGYRVEIGEVERALLVHPLIKDAAVVAWDREVGEKCLAAYIVARTNPGPTTNELRAFLTEKLPDYMIPSAFTYLDSLPLTNGKLDRTALPKPSGKRPEFSQPFVAPRSEVEQELVRIWEEVLDVRAIGIDDNFFDLGGHSLLGVRIMTSIRNEFGVDLGVQTLFEAPTISQMGTQVVLELDEQALRHAEKRKFFYLVELQCGKGKTPVFFFPGGGGSEPEFFVYAPLVRRVGPEYPFYALRAKGADGVSAPHRSVEEMASAYIEEIQSIQPHGPYRLVGECAGGVTAYETARQLRAKGEPVGLLALIDVMRPTLGKYISFRLFRVPEPLRTGWNYYIVRTKYHWEELRNLRWRERLAYVLNQATETPRSDAQPQSANVPTAILQTETSVAMRRHVLRIRENYRRTVRLHRPQPYEGKIEILVSERLHRHDPTLGWNKLARKGLQIHPLPGDHWTYIRDHTETAAEQLRKCLQLADAESQLQSQSVLESPIVNQLSPADRIRAYIR